MLDTKISLCIPNMNLKKDDKKKKKKEIRPNKPKSFYFLVVT